MWGLRELSAIHAGDLQEPKVVCNKRFVYNECDVKYDLDHHLAKEIPSRGGFQDRGMETCTERRRTIELLGSIFVNQKSCSILHSLLSTVNSSCIQDCNVIVSFIRVSMEFHISSSFLALFSNICLFRFSIFPKL